VNREYKNAEQRGDGGNDCVRCMCVEACCAGAEAQKKEGTKMHI
jgi:hypothetical protein